MAEKGVRGIWWLSFQPCVFLSSYPQPFDSALSGTLVPANLYKYNYFWCTLLGATPISQHGYYVNGGLVYLFLNKLRSEPHQTCLLWLLFIHTFTADISYLSAPAAWALPNFAACVISSKKGMADRFRSLTSVSLCCSLSLTNIVDVLVARVFAKAANLEDNFGDYLKRAQGFYLMVTGVYHMADDSQAHLLIKLLASCSPAFYRLQAACRN